METRRFGRTGIPMPVFSCGGMRYQHAWQDGPLSKIPDESQRNLERTIERAFELGIHHIETARGYGTSERQLSQVLPRLPRDKLIFQTKVGPTENAREFQDGVEDSLRRLKLDYLDLLAIHGINDQQRFDWATRPSGCFEAAQRLREQGKVRFVGFSTHGPTDIILKTIQFGGPGTGQSFDYVNLHWYYIFQQNWPAIAAAHERDMGVFIISPSDKGGALYDPPPKLVSLCKPLSPMVFNDLFCLSHPEVHTLSIGASRPSDFDEHVKTLAHLPEAASALQPIVQRLEHAMFEAVGYSSPEALSALLPGTDACPKGLNLKVMLWLRQLVRGWDLDGYCQKRFNLLGNGGSWFPGAKPELLYDVSDEELIRAGSQLPDPTLLPAMLREALARLSGVKQKRLSQSD